MPQGLITLWLYLAKRDKKGVMVLTTLYGKKQSPVRISDLTQLKLPAILLNDIEKFIHEKRMLWEPWLESAETFEKLRESLKNRNYKNIPTNGQPLLQRTTSSPPEINVKNLEKQESMIRKYHDNI